MFPQKRTSSRVTASPVDRWRHEDEVRSEQVLDQWKWNGRRLVDTHELCLAELVRVRRVDVLDRLTMLPEDVHANDRLVELRVGRLDEFIIQVLLWWTVEMI